MISPSPSDWSVADFAAGRSCKMQGPLLKRRRWVGAFRERHFRLFADGTLEYGTSAATSMARGVFVLFPGCASASNGADGELLIVLNFGSATEILRASSETERTAWLDAIRDATGESVKETSGETPAFEAELATGAISEASERHSGSGIAPQSRTSQHIIYDEQWEESGVTPQLVSGKQPQPSSEFVLCIDNGHAWFVKRHTITAPRS